MLFNYLQVLIDHLLVIGSATLLTTIRHVYCGNKPALYEVPAYAFLLIIAQGILLGYTQVLGANSYTILSLVISITLYFWHKAIYRKKAPEWPLSIHALKTSALTLKTHKISLTLSIVITIMLTTLLVFGLINSPLIYDSLTYRLPRIATWLQNQSILHFETMDTRQNFMPPGASLIMLWLTKNFQVGYPLVHLAQFYGGILLLLSLNEIGKYFSFSLNVRLTCLIVSISCANVTPQFISSHTDLLTSGLFACSVLGLMNSLQTRKIDPLAGLCLAAAFGCKGTLFYMAPSIAVGLMVIFVYAKASRSLLIKHTLIFVIGFTALVLPRHIENQIHYGNPFASEALMEAHHPDLGLQETLQKTGLNLASYTIQNLDPNSNLPGAQGITQSLAQSLTKQLPTTDPYLLDQMSRTKTLTQLFNADRADADTSSFGILPIIWLCLGIFLISRLKDATQRRSCILLAISGAIFVLFFCSQQNWHLYAFRYFIILLPFMLPFWGAAFSRIEASKYHKLLPLCILPSLAVFLMIVINTHQVGLRPLEKGLRNRDAYIMAGQQLFIHDLPETIHNVSIALPHNTVSAGLFRNQRGIDFQFAALDLTQPRTSVSQFFETNTTTDAIILPNSKIILEELREYSSAPYIFNGNLNSFFSFTCYYKPSSSS